MQNNNSKNGILIIVLLGIVTILVLFFPKIYDLVNSISMPKVEDFNIEEKEETKEVDESILETIHYPIMRTSIYDPNTYYSLDKFTTNNLSNNDILLNAFLDVYEGNMTAYEGIGVCTNVSKQFSKDYLELRIKNIIGNRINYTLTDFYVPEDSNSKYVGTWSYDSYNNRFLYTGLCVSKATNTKYYNLEELIKVEYDEKDIVAYYYVGFAKVEGSNYIIYSDAKMTNQIANGTFVDVNNLNEVFKSIEKKNKNIYKYTFKNTLCSYNEYCLYEGKWINEI
jgi:hypothetical protein